MFKHTAESILESKEKRFVSQADKDKYDEYQYRFREKEDIYTKEDLASIEQEFKPLTGVGEGEIATVLDTKEGFIDTLEIKGNSSRVDDEIIIDMPMKEGSIDYDNGNYIPTTGNSTSKFFIDVKAGDILRYYNGKNPRAVNMAFYDKDKEFISCNYFEAGHAIEVPFGCAYVKTYNYSTDSDNIKLHISRNIFSVGDKRQDGRYEIPVQISGGVNLFDCESEIVNQMVFGGKMNARRIVYAKLVPNTKYTVSGTYTKTDVIYNGGICISLYNDVPPESDVWFLDKDDKLVYRSESPEVNMNVSFNSENYKYVAVYIGIATHDDHNHTATITNLMLNVGNKALEYTECIKEEVSILSDVPLESLSNKNDILRKSGDDILIDKYVRTYEGVLSEFYLKDNHSYYRVLNIDTVPKKAWNELSGYKLFINDVEIYEAHTFPEVENNDTDILYYVDVEGNRISLTRAAYDLFDPSSKFTFRYASNVPEIIHLPEHQNIVMKSLDGNTVLKTTSKIKGRVKFEAGRSMNSVLQSHQSTLNSFEKDVNNIVRMDNIDHSLIKATSQVLVEGTNKGFIDDVVIEGQTLVNIATVTSANQLQIAGDCDKVNAFIKSEGVYRWEKTENSGKPFYPKILLDTETVGTIVPGRKYTIKYKIKSSRKLMHGFAITNGDAFAVNNGEKYDYDIIRYNSDVYSSHADICVCLEAKEPIKAMETKLAIGFSLYSEDGATAPHWVQIHDLVIVEGDHTDKSLSYFSGVKSVQAYNKKLCLESLDAKNNLCQWEGVCDIQPGIAKSHKYIRVKPISDRITIYFGYNGTRIFSDKVAFRLRDSKGKSLINRGNENDFFTISTTAVKLNQYGIDYRDVEYIEVFWNNLHTENIKINEVAIVDGYYVLETNKPLVNDKKEILYTNENGEMVSPILRRVNDEVKDTIEKHADNKYYYHKRCEEVVINGSETWQRHTTIQETDTDAFFIAYVPGLPVAYDANKVNLVCDKVMYTSRRLLPNARANALCINRGHDKYYYCIKIEKRLLTSNTVEGLIEWLQANPITVVQECKEEVFECSNIDVKTYDKGTLISFDSTVVKPTMKLRVNNDLSHVVNVIKNKLSVLEAKFFEKDIVQNKMMLNTLYSSDMIDLKVDLQTRSGMYTIQNEEDLDVYELICKNILVGAHNYNRVKMEEIIDFYTMIGKLSFETADELFAIIEEQHMLDVE